MKKLLVILALCSLSQIAMADVVDDIKRSNDQFNASNRSWAESTRGLPGMSTTDPRFVPRDTVGTFYIGPNGSYSPNNNYYAPPNNNSGPLPYYYQPQ